MTTTPQTIFYTARTLAAALGRKRQAVQRTLAGSPADGRVMVLGKSAAAWSFAALPVLIQSEIESAAQLAGHRNAQSFLAAPAPPAGRCAGAKPKLVISLAAEADFKCLHDAIAGFKIPGEPNAAEKSYFWLLAIEAYEQKLSQGKAPKKTKRRLLEFLARNAAFLVAEKSNTPLNALRENFRRKYERFIKSERTATALADGRAEKSGRWRGPELTAEDTDKLIAHATLHCGGRVAQAWRELLWRNELSEAVMSYYLANPASKSYVPHKIMEAVKYEVAMMEDIHHGPRQHALNGAYISRDWADVHSMDWWQSDDATKPVYFKTRDDAGNVILMRGQVLPMIDLRSTFILGFVLLSSRNYGANAIRGLITHCADKYGLPRKGFYFENGSWRAKIIKGDVNAGPMSWGESEMGLLEWGMRFIHARLPRAKPIERVIGAMQDLMEGLPGYVGRNEQIEKFERVQKQLREAGRGDADALAGFMDEDQWADKLEQICAQYNATVQNGKMTEGLSPEDAFEMFRNLADPPVKFSPECRYLMAHHRRPVRVTGNGITLRFGNQSFNYRNAETSKLIGRMMFAWFDPETPEILTVTDTHRKNAFFVTRSKDVPAMDATPEQLGSELARIAEHQSYPKARYRTLKAKYAIPFREMVADRKTVALGAQIIEQREAVESRQREDRNRANKVQRMARELNLPANIANDGPEAEEGLRMMREAYRDDGNQPEAVS